MRNQFAQEHETQMLERFSLQYGRPPEVHTYAPGRVNLLGEHTDYNLGFVLPATIPQHTTLMLARREDSLIRAHSLNLNETKTGNVHADAAQGSWFDYIAGLAWAAQRAGIAVSGFDLLVNSTIPFGAGLSSSASLLIAGARALCQAFAADRVPQPDLVQLAHSTEVDFVGANVGIMDPMVCAHAGPEEALWLDCRSLEFERILLPKNLELVVLHSGVTHRLAEQTGDSEGAQTRNYKMRRAECERACVQLGVSSLREFFDRSDKRAKEQQLKQLPPLLQQRVQHILSENSRVLEGCQALKTGNLKALGALFWQSHISERDLYDVSTPEIDLIVKIAKDTPGILGARLTGGGFGGSVVMLAVVGKGRQAGEAIAERYARESGHTPTLLMPA